MRTIRYIYTTVKYILNLQKYLTFIVVEIDKLNKETPVFGPHLLTDAESIRINKPGNIMATVTTNIVENARRQKKKKGKEFL
jgi:hypothetical protein